MIRSSEFGSRQPTREVTAQQYKASVTPAAPPVSGVEKLLDFGQRALQTKFQWDKEAFQADMTIAQDSAEAKIKAMKPEDYVKDPDAAWEAAGGNKMYELLDTAPPGTQKMMRKQLDAAKAQTASTMQATFAVQEHARAVVVNTQSYLEKNGTLTPEMFAGIHKMDEKNQTVAYSAAAQTARTGKSLKFFDDALANPDTPAKERDMLTRVRRETENDIERDRRYQETLARRATKDAEAKAKKMEEAGNQSRAVELVEKYGYTPEMAGLETGTPPNKIYKQLVNTPGALDRARANGTIISQEANQVKAGFRTPSNPDGTMSTSFKKSVEMEQKYLQANGGDPNALVGTVLTEHDALISAASLAEAERTGEPYAVVRHRNTGVIPKPSTLKNLTTAERKDIESAQEGMTVSQKNQLNTLYKEAVARGYGHEFAKSNAVKTVTDGTITTDDGYVINGLSTITNTLRKNLSLPHYDEGFAEKIVVDAIDMVITEEANTRGVTSTREDWVQEAAFDGSVVFRHKTGGRLVVIDQEHFNKVGTALVKTNPRTGEPVAKGVSGYTQTQSQFTTGYAGGQK